MSDFRNCVVSYIDMDGMKDLLDKDTRGAVTKFRELHRTIERVGPTLTSHEEICFWNDSILVVAFVEDNSDAYEQVMQNVFTIKQEVDKVNPSYAICVKGQAFPPPGINQSKGNHAIPGLIYLQASSLAFANCFKIEGLAKKNGWRMQWYIDDRIIDHIRASSPDTTQRIFLFPRERPCILHMFKGSYRTA